MTDDRRITSSAHGPAEPEAETAAARTGSGLLRPAKAHSSSSWIRIFCSMPHTSSVTAHPRPRRRLKPCSAHLFSLQQNDRMVNSSKSPTSWLLHAFHPHATLYRRSPGLAGKSQTSSSGRAKLAICSQAIPRPRPLYRMPPDDLARDEIFNET